MRIAIVTYNFPESTIVLAKHLAAQNCVVDYYYILQYNHSQEIPGFDISRAKLKFGINKLSSADAPETFEYFEELPINVFIIYIYIPIKVNVLIVRQTFLRNILKFINKTKYDFVNIIGQHDLLVAFHNKINCTQKVHTLHEVSNHFTNQQLKSHLLKYLFYNKIKIIVHSKESYNKICLYEQCEKGLIFKIQFGLFETYLHYQPVNLLKKPTKFVLFFGYIKAYKGLDILYEAIALMKDCYPEYKFVIAGSGSSPDLEKMKMNERYIVINKHISNNEIIGLINMSKFIVCPYKSASQTGITKLTFLFEKPIIASDVGAFGEEVFDGQNGLLVKPGSPHDLAAAITKLIENEALYERMKNEVKNSLNMLHYNWNNIAKETLKVYSR